MGLAESNESTRGIAMLGGLNEVDAFQKNLDAKDNRRMAKNNLLDDFTGTKDLQFQGEHERYIKMENVRLSDSYMKRGLREKGRMRQAGMVGIVL